MVSRKVRSVMRRSALLLAGLGGLALSAEVVTPWSIVVGVVAGVASVLLVGAGGALLLEFAMGPADE